MERIPAVYYSLLSLGDTNRGRRPLLKQLTRGDMPNLLSYALYNDATEGASTAEMA
jgi:hypothetical protein